MNRNSMGKLIDIDAWPQADRLARKLVDLSNKELRRPDADEFSVLVGHLLAFYSVFDGFKRVADGNPLALHYLAALLEAVQALLGRLHALFSDEAWTATYKGYEGIAAVADEVGAFLGDIVTENDVITFQADSLPGLRAAFEQSVDDYLEFCASRKEEPAKPLKIIDWSPKRESGKA